MGNNHTSHSHAEKNPEKKSLIKEKSETGKVPEKKKGKALHLFSCNEKHPESRKPKTVNRSTNQQKQIGKRKRERNPPFLLLFLRRLPGQSFQIQDDSRPKTEDPLHFYLTAKTPENRIRKRAVANEIITLQMTMKSGEKWHLSSSSVPPSFPNRPNSCLLTQMMKLAI